MASASTSTVLSEKRNVHNLNNSGNNAYSKRENTLRYRDGLDVPEREGYAEKIQLIKGQDLSKIVYCQLFIVYCILSTIYCLLQVHTQKISCAVTKVSMHTTNLYVVGFETQVLYALSTTCASSHLRFFTASGEMTSL
ncbi:hypothetical protein SNE40_022223 [Patella caerulea]|uniref:Uncharacterized protein n=1 Tax=Patella caerulea TaxID=87958 RepID=A0AAN8FWA0_PATCE